MAALASFIVVVALMFFLGQGEESSDIWSEGRKGGGIVVLHCTARIASA